MRHQLFTIQHHHRTRTVGKGAHAGYQLLCIPGGDGHNLRIGDIDHQLHAVHQDSQLHIVVIQHDQQAVALLGGLAQPKADVQDRDDLAPHVVDAQDIIRHHRQIGHRVVIQDFYYIVGIYTQLQIPNHEDQVIPALDNRFFRPGQNVIFPLEQDVFLHCAHMSFPPFSGLCAVGGGIEAARVQNDADVAVSQDTAPGNAVVLDIHVVHIGGQRLYHDLLLA